jgi:hypothetical protein
MAKVLDQTLPVLAYKKAVVPTLEDALKAIVGRAQLLAWRKGMPSKSACGTLECAALTLSQHRPTLVCSTSNVTLSLLALPRSNPDSWQCHAPFCVVQHVR